MGDAAIGLPVRRTRPRGPLIEAALAAAVAALVLPWSSAKAAEPNVLLGHRACPGFTMTNYKTHAHPAPGQHGIRLQIGCRTAFSQYERYSGTAGGPAAEAAYRAFLAAAKVVTDYHVQNRFGSISPGPAAAGGESSEPAISGASHAAVVIAETQRRALGSSLQEHGAVPLILSETDAREVLLYFFGSVPGRLDDNDRRFAQSLILETAQLSSKMGFIEALFRSATHPSATPNSVVKAIARAALRDLAQPDSVQAALEADHYLAVVNQVTANWRTAWQIRLDDGDSSNLTSFRGR